MNFDFSEKDIALREKLQGLFDPDAMAALSDLERAETEQIRGMVSDWLIRLGQVGYLGLGLETGHENLSLLAAQETLATKGFTMITEADLLPRE